MFDEKSFDEGCKWGADTVLDILETRIYYMPSTWRESSGGYILDILEHTIKSCRRLYDKEGADNGEKS